MLKILRGNQGDQRQLRQFDPLSTKSYRINVEIQLPVLDETASQLHLQNSIQ